MATKVSGVATWMKRNEMEEGVFRIRHNGVAIICQHQISEAGERLEQMMKDGKASWAMIFSIGQNSGMGFTSLEPPPVSNKQIQDEYQRVKKLFRL